MYNHNLIEKKWQKYWHDQNIFAFKNTDKPKFYILDMFPYPSGQGLHVGHIKGYTATDIISRYKRLKGFDVLHPIGWDAFGLPAEQYALQTGNHPQTFTKKNIDNFRRQLISAGFDFDFNKEVDTTDPRYYKWTQWIFSKLFENGLAEIKDVDVNWCEELGTVLANEEVLEIDNKRVSERGNFPVTKKPMRQWVLKITDYAEKLLSGLDEVNWPENLKNIQRNWIGKSVGTSLKFNVDNSAFNLEVFTTRIDTVYGVSYIALAPEHSLIPKLTTPEQKENVMNYLDFSNSKDELSKKKNDVEKTGVFTGAYAVHPLTKKLIPIWVADYVLNNYANAAVMGVPAHDQRDFDFAKKYNLSINFVIKCNSHASAFLDDGKHINSDLINGLNMEPAIKVMNEYLIQNKIGEFKITYKLKDWLFSRQRYWGEPFPILFNKNNNPILEKQLPVILPETNNIKPTGTGNSPLANLKDWMNVKKGNQTYTRETNTMPQWAGSCWYYLGYLMKQKDGSYLDLNSKAAADLFKKWLPVDIYVGGQEHAVLHLLYARFWHRFLYDIKVVPTKEPFYCVINQGMILGSNNEKMSKSKGNVINPDEVIETHGADALRLYECFSGPLTASFPWTTDGLNGSRKWLERVYNLFYNSAKTFTSDVKKINLELLNAYHKFIKSITENIEHQQFNLAISQMMIYVNECFKNDILSSDHLNGFLITLSCFAPHLSEELWNINNSGSVCLQKWPEFDIKKTIDDLIVLPIQENGKLRYTINIKRGLSESDVISFVLSQQRVKEILKGKNIKKTIYIRDKIVNFIV